MNHLFIVVTLVSITVGFTVADTVAFKTAKRLGGTDPTWINTLPGGGFCFFFEAVEKRLKK